MSPGDLNTRDKRGTARDKRGTAEDCGETAGEGGGGRGCR